jgi:hypothetical protein
MKRGSGLYIRTILIFMVFTICLQRWPIMPNNFYRQRKYFLGSFLPVRCLFCIQMVTNTVIQWFAQNAKYADMAKNALGLCMFWV